MTRALTDIDFACITKRYFNTLPCISTHRTAANVEVEHEHEYSRCWGKRWFVSESFNERRNYYYETWLNCRAWNLSNHSRSPPLSVRRKSSKTASVTSLLTHFYCPFGCELGRFPKTSHTRATNCEEYSRMPRETKKNILFSTSQQPLVSRRGGDFSRKHPTFALLSMMCNEGWPGSVRSCTTF